VRKWNILTTIVLVCILIISIAFSISVKSYNILNIIDFEGNKHTFMSIVLDQNMAKYIGLDSPDILRISLGNFKWRFILSGPIMDIVFMA
jgi:hypothetical protein